MRRFALPLLLVACVALAALLSWAALSNATFNRRPDARDTATAERPVTQALPAFRRIDVSGTAEVVIAQTGAETVTYTPPAGGAYVTATVREGTLHLRTGDQARWWDFLLDRRAPGSSRVTVTVKDLEAIAAAGTVKVTVGALRASSLRISGAGGTSLYVAGLTADSLSVSGAGALKAVLSGTVGDQTVTISGAGEYLAADLVSRDATVTVAGAGQVVVHATRTLNATISGAGQVEYLGNPEVTERVSGIGRVKQRGASSAGARPATAHGGPPPVPRAATPATAS